MLLAIDVGNTQTHLGAFEGTELTRHWRFQTRAGATSDELAERFGVGSLEDAYLELVGRKELSRAHVGTGEGEQ